MVRWGEGETRAPSLFSSPSLSLVSPHTLDSSMRWVVRVLCPLFCMMSWGCRSMWNPATTEKHSIGVWNHTEPGWKPGRGILGELLSTSQSLSILICKMGIIIHHLRGVSVRIKWTNAHKALTTANSLCQVTDTCWGTFFLALCFLLSRLNYCSRLLEYFIV